MAFDVTTVRLGPRRKRERLRGADLVIVPGLGLGVASADELDAKLKSPACRRACDMLIQSFEAGATLAAACASTFLLAETGLLDGRRATTTWWLAPLFQRRYPKVELVTDRIVVADWPIATGGAAMAQMDLMLAIVGKFAGPKLASACANYLLLDERRSQVPFMAINYLASQDPKIAQGGKMGAGKYRARFCDRGTRRGRRARAAHICPAHRGDLRRLAHSVRSTHPA